MDDKPILFTISKANESGTVYKVKTNDPRGSYCNTIITQNILFNWLMRITEELGKEGYIVTFKVE